MVSIFNCLNSYTFILFSPSALFLFTNQPFFLLHHSINKYTTPSSSLDILFQQKEDDANDNNNTVEHRYPAKKNLHKMCPLFSSFINTKSSHSVSHFKSSTAETIISQDVVSPYDTSSNNNNVYKRTENNTIIIPHVTSSLTYQQRQKQHGTSNAHRPLLLTRPFEFIRDIHQLFQERGREPSALKTHVVIEDNHCTRKDIFKNSSNSNNNNSIRQQRLQNDGQTNFISFYLTKKLYGWLFHSMVWFEEKILQEQQEHRNKKHKHTSIFSKVQ